MEIYYGISLNKLLERIDANNVLILVKFMNLG